MQYVYRCKVHKGLKQPQWKLWCYPLAGVPSAKAQLNDFRAKPAFKHRTSKEATLHESLQENETGGT